MLAFGARVFTAGLVAVVNGNGALAAETVDYVKQVKPLLTQRCGSCHGALKQEAELRLDAASLIRAGGQSGPAAIAGKSAESPLIHAVEGSNGVTRMPLEGTPLAADEIALLKSWIDQGAVAPEEPIPASPSEHWSFKRPIRPAMPAKPPPASGARLNAIDAFIASSQQSQAVTPLGPAQAHVLLRRVYLDLIGLPPTAEELRSFLQDPSQSNYEQLVDQLLASPRHGERWGRHWMDVWRYSDWAGYNQEIRNSQRHIWRWRDWIIESVNAHKGYDRMIVEMLAGDEVAPADPDVLRATGFVARNWYKFNRNVWLDSLVEHTGKAFLGLTFNCARCHDHRYDPIEQANYYQLRAFFEPHQVRTDRVPGQGDLLQDGLPRVYDADANTPTYLFVRGDETQPDKEHPLSPGLPKILAPEPLKIEAVPLTPDAYYPAKRDFVQRETHDQAVVEVEKQRKAWSEAVAVRNATQAEVEKLANAANLANAPAATAAAATPAPSAADVAAAQGKLADAATSLRQLEIKLGSAEANLLAIDARLAADRARFATPPDAHAESLAFAASRAQRQAAVWAIEQELFDAQLEFTTAQQATMPVDPALGALLKARLETLKKAKPDAESLAKAATDAQAKVEATQKRLSDAQQAAKSSSGDYSTIDTVYPAQSTGRRLALARWIANTQNPLTARVAINHIWMRHFGEPLVSTVFDFGMRGQRPTHPELLDWLAVELMERGWSMKAIHRLIVTSEAYRRASASTSDGDLEAIVANKKIDPDNRYLWRMNPRRMEAETVRDSVLAVAGQLDVATGGPDLDHEQGLTSHRRSVYFRHASEKQMMFLRLFDTASVTECYRRSESIVPQQGLALANSPLAIEQARRAAAALSKLDSGDGNAGQFVVRAFEQVLTRAPSAAEQAECLKFLQEQAAVLTAQANNAAPAEPKTDASGATPDAITPPSTDPHQRARESLLLVLLNHHDFVTIR